MRIASGLGVVFACLAWLLTQRFVAGRGWRVAPALLLVPAILFTANELRWHRFEAGLASAVSPVLGAGGGHFGCERLMHNFWSSQGYVGHVRFDGQGRPADEAFLSSSTCARVRAWRKHADHPDLAEIVAVHTVTHEAEHLSGVRSEADAECRAIEADAQVMQRLGASPSAAAAAVGRYVREVYPRLPSEYVGECPAVTAAGSAP